MNGVTYEVVEGRPVPLLDALPLAAWVYAKPRGIAAANMSWNFIIWLQTDWSSCDFLNKSISFEDMVVVLAKQTNFF